MKTLTNIVVLIGFVLFAGCDSSVSSEEPENLSGYYNGSVTFSYVDTLVSYSQATEALVTHEGGVITITGNGGVIECRVSDHPDPSPNLCA